MLEETYNTRIRPLMDQIIEVCQESGINMLANFQLDNEGNKFSSCLTALFTNSCDKDMQEAARILAYGAAEPVHFGFEQGLR